MASLQQKISHGQKYWYIVESRRVNGKPRPVVLAYLSKADTLLERLQQLDAPCAIKSYAHGAVAALLRVARELDIVQTINQYVHGKRENIEARINAIVNKQFIRDLFVWELSQTKDDCWRLAFHVDQAHLEQVENMLGWRILMTDRHDWDSAQIIQTFHGQANIENAFRSVKNPYHLAVRRSSIGRIKKSPSTSSCV